MTAGKRVRSDLLVLTQAAKILQISRNTLRGLIDHGQVAGVDMPCVGGRQHERRVPVVAALAYARRYNLPCVGTLEEIARDRGLGVALPAPPLLLASPDRGAAGHFPAWEVAVCYSCVQLGRLAGQRTYRAVVLDTALGTHEVGEAWRLLRTQAPRTLVAVMMPEDWRPLASLPEFEGGPGLLWKKPVDLDRAAAELWDVAFPLRRAA